MIIQDHISESLETIFWVKILKFLDADPGFGIFLTLDPEWKNSDPGSIFLTLVPVLVCTYRFDATLVDDSKGAVSDEVLGVELVNPHARRHCCNRG